MPLSLTAALPRLTAAYHRGLLVPFLGAGMSRETCPGWQALVEALAKDAGVSITGFNESAGGTPTTTSDQLIRVANQVIRVLRRDSSTRQYSAVRRALYGGGHTPPIPAQASTLARVWWPLVISTNYDDLFARAYVAARNQKPDESLADRYGSEHLTVLGRGESDCRRVLASLDVTGRSILWAIHGFLPQRDSARAGFECANGLERDIIFGHEEYRRMAHASPQYRRAFAEVYRRRSLLFLGAGLKDVYLLDLFAEVQELYGVGPHPHFALVAKGEEHDADFLRSRFNINVIEIDSYEHVDATIGEIATGISSRSAHAAGWEYATGIGEASAKYSLRVSADELPALTSAQAGEAIAVSAGLNFDNRSAYLSDGVRQAANTLAKTMTADLRSSAILEKHPEKRFAFASRASDGTTLPLIALCPWRSVNQRDLRMVGDAAMDGFSWANEGGFHTLHMMLLGAGDTRPFAARFSLAEIVRAWGRWQRTHHLGASTALRTLALHVVNSAALFELTSGRLDAMELLTTSDLRFWFEVIREDGTLVDREPLFRRDDETISEIAAAYRLPVDVCTWSVDPTPDATSGESSDKVHRSPITAESTLRDVGVLAGSTLRVIIGARS